MTTRAESADRRSLDTASGFVPELRVAMGDSAKKLRSVYEQFLDQPDNVVAEVVHGALVTSPRPASPHAHAASALGIVLGGPFWLGQQGPGGWLILDEPELQIDKHILVPDLAAWRRERMPDALEVQRFELAPDWVCEVLSPSTQALDRADKLPIYASHGVSHAWLIDPASRMIEIYRLESGRWVVVGTHRDDAVVRAEPFDAIELKLSALWWSK
jgi:Uma2 family endonuclease